MKTTRKDLAKMLATDGVIQERYMNRGKWRDMKAGEDNFDLNYCEYRLKPKITYYRIYLQRGEKSFNEGDTVYSGYHFQIEE